MNLDYAIDRLYDTGWTPTAGADIEDAADGRAFPTIAAIEREFTAAGLALSIKHNPLFKCYRATWGPLGKTPDPGHAADQWHGTVIGTCEREAAVYAMAQLRAAKMRQMALV